MADTGAKIRLAHLCRMTRQKTHIGLTVDLSVRLLIHLGYSGEGAHKYLRSDVVHSASHQK